MDRTIEIFAGAYASGKSETALNRARLQVESGKNITLIDLDSVEPAYTLRPIADELTKLGINVITQPDSFGLGEAASYITSAQINILDIITDINLETDIKIYLVINTAKFETSTVDNIIEYVDFSKGIKTQPWKNFYGFISNTHFGDETTKEDIINGYTKLKKVSEITNIPIKAIGVPEFLAHSFETNYDDTEIWVYKRMMPRAFW